jgi:IS5 family transposase
VRAQKLTSHIHCKGKRGKPLTEPAKGSNRTKSPVRACAKIAMKNLSYNMRRLVQLRRINQCPA